MLIFLFILFVNLNFIKMFQLNNDLINANNIIKLTAYEHTNIELKSIFDLHANNDDQAIAATQTNPETTTYKSKDRLFWSFKRIYFIYNSTVTTSQRANNDLMIALDNEVEENLKQKYSIIDNYNYNLLIKNLTFMDSGYYICNIWNQKKLIYELVVNSQPSKPLINLYLNNHQEPIRQTNVIKEFDNIYLKCITKYGYPFPDIKWYKNNIEITTIPTQTKLIDDETLTIENTINFNNLTSDMHSTNFTCQVEQKKFHKQQDILVDDVVIESDDFLLNVTYKPIIDILILNNNNEIRISNKIVHLYKNNINNGNNVIFKCKYNSNPKPNSILWFKNGALIDNNLDNSIGFIDDEFNYQLKQSDESFQNLTCFVNNTNGESQSTIEIKFMHEPVSTLNQTYYEVVENEPLVISCTFNSYPLASSIKWRRLSDSVIISNSSVLDFKSIKRGDAGFYECIAENQMIDIFEQIKVGKMIQQINVNVFFQPKMYNLITNKQAFTHTNQTNQLIKLYCLTSSNPEPEIKWYKINELNKSKIELSNSTKYSIMKVSKKRNDFVYESVLNIYNANADSDLGKYECEILNRFGINSLIIELVNEQTPDIPLDFRLVYSNYTQLTLAWSKNFDGGYDQSFELDVNQSRQVTNLTQTIYNLTNLNINTTYSVRLRAHNQLGPSGWTSYLIVNTLDLTNKNDMPKLSNLTFYLNENLNILLIKFKLANLLISNVSLCMKIKIIDNVQNSYGNISDCISIDYNQTIIKINNIKIPDTTIIPNLKSAVCLVSNKQFCGEEAIAIYDKSNHGLNMLHYYSVLNSKTTAVPITLIIGICLCIALLFVLLFVTIIYFIRKRGGKLCSFKKNQDYKEGVSKTINKLNNEHKFSHVNKTFNIDIASISAPISNTMSINGIASSRSTASTTSTSSTTSSTSSQLDQTDDAYPNRQVCKIQVTEDEEQIKKQQILKQASINEKAFNNLMQTNTSDLSDCSSVSINKFKKSINFVNNYDNLVGDRFVYNSNNNQLMTLDRHSLHENQIQLSNLECNKETNSLTDAQSYRVSVTNSDPVVVDNSISSTNTSKSDSSQIYGYNLANLVINKEKSSYNQIINLDLPANKNLFSQQQQQLKFSSQTVSSSIAKIAITESFSDTYESDYSATTPSKNKKVVYEVIV